MSSEKSSNQKDAYTKKELLAMGAKDIQIIDFYLHSKGFSITISAKTTDGLKICVELTQGLGYTESSIAMSDVKEGWIYWLSGSRRESDNVYISIDERPIKIIKDIHTDEFETYEIDVDGEKLVHLK